MNKLLALAIILCIGSAGAQPTAPFIGNWKVVWQGDKQEYEARLVITETGGSWQAATQSKRNPCAGRQVPVRIDSTTPTELNLTLRFSEVVNGCNDSPVVLTTGAGNVVTGKRGEAALVLTKDK